MSTYTETRKMPCGVRGCTSRAVGSWRPRRSSVAFHLCATHASQFQRKGRKVHRWMEGGVTMRRITAATHSHTVRVDPDSSSGAFRSYCVCGWRSARRSNPNDADSLGESHVARGYGNRE